MPPASRRRTSASATASSLERHIDGLAKIRIGQGKLKIGRHWISIWALVLLGFVAALGFAAKPAYHAYRTYRINQNFEEAKTAARQEDWRTARDKALSVLLARRTDFDAYRIWTRAISKLGENRAFLAASELFSDPRATREDRLETLQTLALQAPQAQALHAYSSLPEPLRNQAAFRAAITPLLVKRGESAAAEKRLREVLRPDDGPPVRLELLRTLCQRPNVWRMAEARRIFADFIAAKADEQALAALLLLGEIPRALAPGLALPDLPSWLNGLPKATAIHHLTALTPALEARPASAEHIFNSAIKRFLATDPAVLGSWLARHNQADKAAAILEGPAKTSADAYLARLHVLLRLRRDAGVEAALAAAPATVDLVDIEIASAMLAWLREKPILAEAALNRAMNRAALDTNHNRFIEIALIAQQHGAKTATLDAWVAAIRMGCGQLPLYQDLQSVIIGLAAKNRSEDLLAICRTLRRFEPSHPDLLNNFNYLALLHGIVPPDVVTTAQLRLMSEFPARKEFNSTLMLAEMLAGHPADALDCLPKLRDCKGVEPMMKTALEGSARVMFGETEAGASLLQQVDWSSFMRQERNIFRDILVKLKVASIPLPVIKGEPLEADSDQSPAWRKAVERLEKDRAADVLPSLNPSKDTLETDQSPAWRKTVERLETEAAADPFPVLLPPKGAADSSQSPAWRKAVEQNKSKR
ncbi:MAG: hypothetical protein WCP35_06625 [Verrucomicrobiota bacterium]